MVGEVKRGGSENKNWWDKTYRIWRIASRKMSFVENERKHLSELSKVGDVVLERDVFNEE